MRAIRLGVFRDINQKLADGPEEDQRRAFVEWDALSLVLNLN